MKIFPTSGILQLDAYTIEHEPIASIDLMERAAQAVACEVMARFYTRQRIVIIAGPGNNGGDEDVAGNGDQPTSSSSQAGKPATATSAATGDAPRAIASLALGAAAAAAAAAFAHKRQRMARGKHCR